MSSALVLSEMIVTRFFKKSFKTYHDASQNRQPSLIAVEPSVEMKGKLGSLTESSISSLRAPITHDRGIKSRRASIIGLFIRA